MRMTRFAAICVALGLTGAALPALAQPDRGPDGPPPGAGYEHHWQGPVRYDGPRERSRDGMPESVERTRWIDECADRIGGRYGRDECERYLHDYYAYYMRSGYGQQGFGSGCCTAQPMMMVPVRPVRSEPRCTETVEVTYEDVPVAAPRRRVRPAPDKRIKVAPDKRIRLAPDKRIGS